MAPASQRPRRAVVVEPPPRRILAEGLPARAELSEAQTAEVRLRLGDAVEALRYELEAVKAESDMVSSPDLRGSLAVIGPHFTPQQARHQMIADARALGTVAERMLGGALSPYLSDEQRAALRMAVADGQRMVEYTRQFDLQAPSGGHAILAEDHVRTHVAALNQAVEEAERIVVMGEAPSVPVREPGEGTSTLGLLLALGALVAVGVIVAELA
jgi:hypothetical protein